MEAISVEMLKISILDTSLNIKTKITAAFLWYQRVNINNCHTCHVSIYMSIGECDTSNGWSITVIRITYPFPNFNGAVGVWEWESNLFPDLIGHVIICPYWEKSDSISKKVPNMWIAIFCSNSLDAFINYFCICKRTQTDAKQLLWTSP